MEQAFKMFDLDGNGFITKDELQAILGGTNIEEETLKRLIEECDNNGDGKVGLIYNSDKPGRVRTSDFQEVPALNSTKNIKSNSIEYIKYWTK